MDEELQQLSLMFAFGGEVTYFVGIAPEVEQLIAVHLWILDQFPAIAANHAMDIAVGAENPVAVRLSLAFHERQQTSSFNSAWNCFAGQFANGRVHVEKIAER